jgi:radical SAM superfamily enzyme YgiQ (UPF0313 family)
VFVIVGGHSASAFPEPFFDQDVNAICLDDGERGVPALVTALERKTPLDVVPGWLLRRRGETPHRTCDPTESFVLDDVPLPARHAVAGWRKQYACLHHRPTYLIETARGCPFRCTFCSVWQLFDRTVRERSIGSVCDDFADTGDHVFVADDLFWHHASRSEALAKALVSRGIRKDWVLVQSRVDLVARHPQLLEAWRPIAREFDIFFGLEAATEADFERLWAFVDRHRLTGVGFTILTPLPGTSYFDTMRSRIRAVQWSQFDMHHLLWEPRLGAQRFFELYCETWRRSVLNLKGSKKWWHWAAQARPRHWAHLARVLRQTQRMMHVPHYVREHRLSPAGMQEKCD